MKAKQRLLTYLKPFRSSLVVALIFALLFVVAQIGQPFLLGRALDASEQEFFIYVFVALGLAILGTIFAYLFEVIVSQRVATIQNADFILVLEGGQVVGQGKHEDLLKNCPIYKEIYETQVKRG